jgi:hypothetical protein
MTLMSLLGKSANVNYVLLIDGVVVVPGDDIEVRIGNGDWATRQFAGCKGENVWVVPSKTGGTDSATWNGIFKRHNVRLGKTLDSIMRQIDQPLT